MSFLYSSAQFLSKSYFNLFHNFEVVGLENIPEKTPFLLASNHASFIDPPALGCLVQRDICYLARKSLFKFPFNFILNKLNAIPLQRERLDLKTLKTILKCIDRGKGVLIFPEGTRSENGEIKRAKSGIGFIVEMAKVPIIPAKVIGSFEILPRGRLFPKLGQKLIIKYGVPFNTEEEVFESDKKTRYQKIADLIMSRIDML